MNQLHSAFWYAAWARRLAITAILSLFGALAFGFTGYESFGLVLAIATIVFGVVGWIFTRRATEKMPSGPEEIFEEMESEHPDLFDAEVTSQFEELGDD